MPLWASWLLMTVEGPILQGLMARRPDSTLQLAAFGVTLALEIAIESPVIMLLATSTRLTRDRPSYRVLRRFVITLNAALTAVAALLAFTPLFDVLVLGWMDIPPPIAAAVRPALQIMTPWTAAIGWRRFLQGILIRTGRTRSVSAGTALRLIFSAGTGALLAFGSDLPGAEVGAWALLLGVTAEALFIHWLAREAVAELAHAGTPEPLRMAAVVRFHLPLAMTSLLSLLLQPLISAGLARLPDEKATLAAWPVLFAILMVFQSGGFALPEVVIALHRGPDGQRVLQRFAGLLLVIVVASFAVFALTPLGELYLRRVAGLEPSLIQQVRLGMIGGAALPVLHLVEYWRRGLLVSLRSTSDIYRGMGLQLALATAGVLIGVHEQWPGMHVVTASLAGAMLAEVVFLGRRVAARLARTGYHE